MLTQREGDVMAILVLICCFRGEYTQVHVVSAMSLGLIVAKINLLFKLFAP